MIYVLCFVYIVLFYIIFFEGTAGFYLVKLMLY